MIVVIISWIYMLFLCMLAGIGIHSAGHNILKSYKNSDVREQASIMSYLVSGIVVITVYAEIFSIFGGVSVLAQTILLVFALVIGFVERKRIVSLWNRHKWVLCSWEGFFYLCFILFAAFFTSRGTFHTDTNIYHAQAIHFYEEYGLVKGLGNLQLHYAYNSAYLAFASFFSFHWLAGQPPVSYKHLTMPTILLV